MIKVNNYVNKEQFYPIYKDWCDTRDFPAIHIDNIEEVFVAYKKEAIDNEGGTHYASTPIYSVFLWNTNSKMCLIGFPMSNPHIKYEDKEGGLDILFEEVSKHCKERGYVLVWTTSATPTVIESLENNKFIKGDENIHQYVKVL